MQLSGARVDLTWGSLDFHRASLQNLQVSEQAECLLFINEQHTASMGLLELGHQDIGNLGAA